MFNFNNVYHLFARHPAIAGSPDVLKWLQIHGASAWRETDITDAEERDVLLVSHDEMLLLAIRVRQRFFEDMTTLTSRSDESILLSAEFDLTASPTKIDAVSAVASLLKVPSHRITELTPEVTFSGGRYGDRFWTVRARTTSEEVKLRVDAGKAAEESRSPFSPASKSSGPIVIMNEWLATNDIHSPYLFKQQAESWTVGPLTVREKAFRIFSNVKRLYKYDSTITHISEFTWRDTLVRDSNNYRGICDEWAVVQISYLRSIGIESRLKFMIWTQNGSGVGHACLEFNDGGRWTHMDALWDAFDYPSRYRASGAQNLTVMDADYPMDARSTQPAWGVPDPTGDGKLYPYGDFVINPRYPGNSRPGYSS